MGLRGCLRKFWLSRTLWLAFLVPILASPLPAMYPNSEATCGYCVLIIAVYWVTEILPLPVTSLLPVFLFPVFGIMSASAVCGSYVNDTLMLFLGSLIVAVAVEKWNLHKRLALRTLTLVGPEPKWLLLGVMMPTWFLSMWMSNTATTAMMVPIVAAILTQIRECQTGPSHTEEALIDEDQGIIILVEENAVDGMENNHTNHDNSGGGKHKLEESTLKNRAAQESQFLAFAKTFSLATAFSANIGGMATLTGTPPNVIFKALADTLYKKYGANMPINFANWMVLGIPLAVVLIIFLWLWMQLYSEGIG